MALRINLVTRWRCVVSFTPRLLYPRGKNYRYPLDTRLGGPTVGLKAVKTETLYLCWESNHGCPTRRLASMLTELNLV
jgi:hypothetical protein